MNETIQNIILVLHEQGLIKQSDLKKYTAYSLATICEYLITLEKMGLVTREKETGAYVIKLTPEGEELSKHIMCAWKIFQEGQRFGR